MKTHDALEAGLTIDSSVVGHPCKFRLVAVSRRRELVIGSIVECIAPGTEYDGKMWKLNSRQLAQLFGLPAPPKRKRTDIRGRRALLNALRGTKRERKKR